MVAIADENPWALSDDEAPESSTVLVAHGPNIADVSAANPSAAYAEFNKSQRAKVVKFCRSGPRDRLLVLAISLMLSISVLRVVEHVGSDAFQVKAWRKCSSGEYSSRIVAVWQGILQNTADEEMRRLQQCDAWRAIRPAGRTVGLCTLAFSLVFSVACGMEQLLLAPFGAFLMLCGTCCFIHHWSWLSGC